MARENRMKYGNYVRIALEANQAGRTISNIKCLQWNKTIYCPKQNKNAYTQPYAFFLLRWDRFGRWNSVISVVLSLLFPGHVAIRVVPIFLSNHAALESWCRMVCARDSERERDCAMIMNVTMYNVGISSTTSSSMRICFNGVIALPIHLHRTSTDKG